MRKSTKQVMRTVAPILEIWPFPGKSSSFTLEISVAKIDETLIFTAVRRDKKVVREGGLGFEDQNVPRTTATSLPLTLLDHVIII